MAKTLVSFNAGRCEWDSAKKLVTPDPRKGQLALVQDEDELIHVQWTERSNAVVQAVVDDFVVVNDAYLERVTKVTDGRVFVLRSTSGVPPAFFWMQEIDEARDVALITKFNDAIGCETRPKDAAGLSAGAGVPAHTGGADLLGALQNAGAGNTDQARLLARFLAGAGGATPAAPAVPAGPVVQLGDVITPDVMRTLLEDEDAVKELAELVPQSSNAAAEVRAAMDSSWSGSTIRLLGEAVNSDQLPALASQLGLSVAPGSGVEGLIKALEEKHKK